MPERLKPGPLNPVPCYPTCLLICLSQGHM